jgi:hypothetical protein
MKIVMIIEETPRAHRFEVEHLPEHVHHAPQGGQGREGDHGEHCGDKHHRHPEGAGRQGSREQEALDGRADGLDHERRDGPHCFRPLEISFMDLMIRSLLLLILVVREERASDVQSW